MQCIVCHHSEFQKLQIRFQRHRLARCQTCGLVQLIPMLTHQDIEALYHEDMDHFTPYIEQVVVHQNYFRKKIQEIFAVIPRHATSITLLDIGCAMGVLLEEAEKEGMEVYGVDISSDAVTYCKKRGFRVSQTYPKKHFDAITAFEVLEHEQNPMSMINRIYKLLNNGGIVVLTTPNHDSFWRKIMGRWWVGYKHPEHVTFWNKKSLTFLLTKAGFKNITVTRDSPRPFPLSFLFTRSADYFPWFAWALNPLGHLLDRFAIINPINPWDDLIVYGRK